MKFPVTGQQGNFSNFKSKKTVFSQLLYHLDMIVFIAGLINWPQRAVERRYEADTAIKKRDFNV